MISFQEAEQEAEERGFKAGVKAERERILKWLYELAWDGPPERGVFAQEIMSRLEVPE